MAYSIKLADGIRAALAHLPNVKEKKMFGSLAFMVDDKMCLAAGLDRIMCRIGPDAYQRAVEKEGCGPVVMKGRKIRGYVYVNEKHLAEKGALTY